MLGTLEYRARRPAEARYAAIAPLFKLFKRPFSVLDVGANDGYFGGRAARDFGAVSTLVEPTDALRHWPDCLHVKAGLSPEQLAEFGVSEHFDVVLCLSVLHHVPQWREFMDALFSLGDRVMAEFPDGERRCHGPHVEQAEEWKRRGGQEIARADGFWGERDSRSVRLYETPKRHIGRGAFYADMRRQTPPTRRTYGVESSLSEKWLVKGSERRPWIHGVNMWSFLCVGGIWPTRQELADMVRATGVPRERHGDIRPWNYVVDGRAAHLIDPGSFHPDDGVALAYTINWLLEGGPCS